MEEHRLFQQLAFDPGSGLGGSYMRGKNLAVTLQAALTIFSVILLCGSTLAGGREKVLHNFNDNDKGNGGASPSGNLILNADGNFYGTASGWGSQSQRPTDFRQGAQPVLRLNSQWR